MCRADTDWLLEDDPGDTLQQGGRGQRAIIGPIIQTTRKESLRVEVSKSRLLSLQVSEKEGKKRGIEEEKKEGKTMTMKLLVSHAYRMLFIDSMNTFAFHKLCFVNCGTGVFTLVLIASKVSRTF